jgi:hypothetical protein
MERKEKNPQKERPVSISVSAESERTLKLIALKQNFKTNQGKLSRSKAVEYLIKNFETPIA